MTEPVRVRAPWLGVLAPTAAAVFSAAVVWAGGHHPRPAPVAAPAQPAASVGSPARDRAAIVDRQIAAQRAQLGRLSADVRALRAALARATTRSAPSVAPSPAAAQRPAPSALSTLPAPGVTRRPAPSAPRPTAAARPTRTTPPPAPPVPSIPAPHVTTGSS